ncbi:MAG TPA: hypothetical protein VFY51_05070 [Pyrinomonadaceae bacterium]|nr:hypothetical protein [Pyrinomonadaceae bacterium]
MNKPQLVNVLIGKSIAETILIGAIAVGVYLNAFPPTFHGWGEAVVQSKSIAGWAVNDADPWQRLQVQLFIDGKPGEEQVANLSRPDVVAAGWAKDEWHGYNFSLPSLPAGNHEARVYVRHESGDAARYTLQLLGDPIRFVVNADGSWGTIR